MNGSKLPLRCAIERAVRCVDLPPGGPVFRFEQRVGEKPDVLVAVFHRMAESGDGGGIGPAAERSQRFDARLAFSRLPATDRQAPGVHHLRRPRNARADAIAFGRRGPARRERRDGNETERSEERHEECRGEDQRKATAPATLEHALEQCRRPPGRRDVDEERGDAESPHQRDACNAFAEERGDHGDVAQRSQATSLTGAGTGSATGATSGE